MKKLYLSVLIMCLAMAGMAQGLPVNWSYTAKKISANEYQLHITAVLQPGWHVYSQTQPQDAIATPTSIKFTTNPLVAFDGKPKENGDLEKVKEPTLGIEAWQYQRKVDFVQDIKLKVTPATGKDDTTLKTNIKGTVAFQVCTDEKCLPPTTLPFSISIEAE